MMGPSYRLEINSVKSVLAKRGLEERGRVQRFVDSEVLRRASPFVPLRTGTLMRSGPLSTSVGSGVVTYNAPYASAQYYKHRKVGSATGALRGPMWFERMKSSQGKAIIQSAAQMAGGTSK